MNKLQMAHEFMMKKMETETIDNHWELFYSSWRYADAMQAEADKRVVKLPDVFFDTNKNDEWQPDWSQAPDWANWWCLSVMHGAMWFSREPICTKSTWVMLNDVKFCAASFDEAPSFNYAGNWQDSLRKRPQ